MKLPMRSDETHRHRMMASDDNQTAGNKIRDLKIEISEQASLLIRKRTSYLEKLGESPATKAEPMAGFPFTLELVCLLN